MIGNGNWCKTDIIYPGELIIGLKVYKKDTPLTTSTNIDSYCQIDDAICDIDFLIARSKACQAEDYFNV